MNNILLFLNISGGEILVILVVVYLVLGPKKIPELARMLGKGINELRRATNDIKREITKEMSGIKKEMNLDDIDLKDPLNINKKPVDKKPEQTENNEKKEPPTKPNPEETYI
ncbi:MAG: twin-arginine translocase TatA/TatE family subunit [Bacteroidales bacterium]